MKKENIIIEFTELEKRVLNELDRKDFPDLQFIYSEEVLSIVSILFDKLLQVERNKFYKLLEIKDEIINFEIFEDEEKLSQLFNLISHLESVDSTENLRNIINDFQPKYIELGNEMAYSKRFYDIHTICRDKGGLNSDQKRVLDLAIRDFERNGINLSEEKQTRLKEINQLCSKLSFDFSNNVLDSEKEFEYVFSDNEFIKDVPKDVLDNAQELAKKDGIEGYKFLSDFSSYSNVMKYCSNSEIRKFFFSSRKQFASKGKYDNRPLILELLALRQELASILGFSNYGELSLDEKMAKSPEEVMKQDEIINERANIKAKVELKEIKDFFNIKEINQWDTAFYSRIIKEQKYEVSDKILREYFEYDKVIEGLFNIAKKLYDIEFSEIKVLTQDNNIKVYEVFKGGVLQSYFIMDMFYRQGKSSGAWANSLRSLNNYKGKTRLPIVINVCSFQKSKNTTLLNYSDVSTMFHEFGHALHIMSCQSKYSQLSGSNVEWDFVELPSQLMENWCEGEGLKSFAYHYKTGENISDDLINKLNKLKTFFNGVSTIYYIALSKVDMVLHTQKVPKTIAELDKIVLDIINDSYVFKFSENDKIHASFSHIFAGAYAAGFYSYLRAEIIEADIFSEFKKNGIFDKKTSDRFYNTILSQGAKKPAIELFRDFMGREVSLDAFFEKKGL